MALRPSSPSRRGVPNAIRNLDPMDATGSTRCSTASTPEGSPTAPIKNQMVNFGWEYVWHCHILSHEEMDMMRPQSVAMPPVMPDGLAATFTGTGALQVANLTWNDNSITETASAAQRSTDLGATWTDVGTIVSPLDQPNIHQPRAYTDPSTFDPATTVRYYRILARNSVGYVADPAYPSMTVQSVSPRLVVGPSFDIEASAGAGGSITPSGTVTVGQGGSQTFTITPDANYGVLEVLVDGSPVTLTDGTYTFTDVQANHTIAATFTQGVVVITSSAGAGGSIAPNGTQTVPINGDQTYTITPNNGYVRDQVLVDGVNDPAAVTSGTHTFANVVADHTIHATFAQMLSSITVTAPVGTTSLAQGDALPVTWTTNTVVPSGEFSLWAVSTSNGWYGGKIVAADGTASYADTLAMNVPADTGYRIYVYYRTTSGDPWSVYGFSTGTVDVTATFNSITVTAPTGTTSQAQGSALPVTWTTNQAVASGEFSLWVVSTANGWYGARSSPPTAPPATPTASTSMSRSTPATASTSTTGTRRRIPGRSTASPRVRWT